MKLKTSKNTNIDIFQRTFKSSEWAKVDNGWWETVPNWSHTSHEKVLTVLLLAQCSWTILYRCPLVWTSPNDNILEMVQDGRCYSGTPKPWFHVNIFFKNFKYFGVLFQHGTTTSEMK